MTRGRPFEPGNKFGRGRPKGSRNKRTLLAKEILDEVSPALVRKTVTVALQGDKGMLRTLLPYIMPRPKDLPVNIGTLKMDTIDDLIHSHDVVLKKVTSSQISSDQAKPLFDAIEARQKLIETRDLTQRISALEQQQLSKQEKVGSPV